MIIFNIYTYETSNSVATNLVECLILIICIDECIQGDPR